MKLPSVYDSLEYESTTPLRKYNKQLLKINKYQDAFRAMSEDELKQDYLAWLEKIGTFEITNKKHVQYIFALAREVTYRLTGKFQYDVQILGALATLDRNMIQMSTGSGKTITIILPAVAFGLMHQGVYVLTVNDYLSKRDWEENKPVYDWFNLTNGYTTNEDDDTLQQDVFSRDIIYCTNSSLGFAYLNSELASDIGQDIKVINRPLYAAIIDEADEILMDDARNPLIIADSKDVKGEFTTINHNGRIMNVQEIVDKLKTLSNIGFDDEDNTTQVFLNDKALHEIQDKLDLDDSMFEDAMLMHVIYSATNAIFQNHVYTDYIVVPTPDPDTGSRIVLIDKATGRLSHGRTLSDNMHVFVEMKEGVFTGQSTDSSIQITYQTLFNLFTTIAGVSGTLGASYKEFIDIYHTGVVLIPDRFPNKLQQLTHLYTTQVALYDDLVTKIKFYVSAHHPVLVGATSDIGVDMLSNVLSRAGIEHKTLVSTDQNEDAIIADAGKPGSVVVTTDIMGRGTDIHVTDVQGERGLVVFQVGDRPNSRIERQFAGRAARQGQPGRFHRMLTVSELSEIGVSEPDVKSIMTLFRSNKDMVEHYNFDILLNGRSPEYDELLSTIDHALVATESQYSTSRVEDFKSYSITDIVQTSLLMQMDGYRKILKDAMEKQEIKPLQELAAELSIDDTKKKKQHIQRALLLVEQLPVKTLEEMMFKYIGTIVSKVIPAMRAYSDSAIDTTKLAGQVKFDQKPEDMMISLLKKFLAEQHDAFVFKIEAQVTQA